MSEPARRLVRLEPELPRPHVATRFDGRGLSVIDAQTRPTLLARDELTPVLGAFEGLLGTSGLRRGSTVVVESAGSPGASSVALGLLAAATSAGRWCAVVGLASVGLAAASELGLALDRLVVVPFASTRPAKVLAPLLEGCEIVLVAGWAYPNLGETRRLAAHARERRSILLPLRVGSFGLLGRWPVPPDVSLRVVGSRPVGIDRGGGHLHSRFVTLEATRRRISPRTVTAGVWLPSPNGSIVAGDSGELVRPAGE